MIGGLGDSFGDPDERTHRLVNTEGGAPIDIRSRNCTVKECFRWVGLCQCESMGPLSG
jgi:hypothetical protein